MDDVFSLEIEDDDAALNDAHPISLTTIARPPLSAAAPPCGFSSGATAREARPLASGVFAAQRADSGAPKRSVECISSNCASGQLYTLPLDPPRHSYAHGAQPAKLPRLTVDRLAVEVPSAGAGQPPLAAEYHAGVPRNAMCADEAAPQEIL